MVTILSAVVSILAFRFRSRASLELKLIALQHQLAVLRRMIKREPADTIGLRRTVAHAVLNANGYPFEGR